MNSFFEIVGLVYVGLKAKRQIPHNITLKAFSDSDFLTDFKFRDFRVSRFATKTRNRLPIDAV